MQPKNPPIFPDSLEQSANKLLWTPPDRDDTMPDTMARTPRNRSDKESPDGKNPDAARRTAGDPPADKKYPPGKRPRPPGGLNVRLPPALWATLQFYIGSQEEPPTEQQVMRRALREYLHGRGVPPQPPA
jgi:hypothetical protein